MKWIFLVLVSSVAFGSTPSFDYESKYHLFNVNDKLVNNRGDGYEELYGVRNFRVVLRGIVYRGGANNAYNKYGKRDNSNPLPDLGLMNLCKEGFKRSIYLYSTNYKTAPPQTKCQSFLKEANTLQYDQITGLSYSKIDLFISPVFSIIKGVDKGPLYLHCWNGWHSSGFVSAILLRQFCGYTGGQALQYWIKNTDGASNGYEELKKQIIDFKPRSQFQITDDERKKICF